MVIKARKGDAVVLHLHTGVPIGLKEILGQTEDAVFIWIKRKGEVLFDKETGRQIDPLPKNPRFANYITEDDGSYQPKGERVAKGVEMLKKKRPKKRKPKPPEEPFYEEDYEEEEIP
jgi:hypothetical protein